VPIIAPEEMLFINIIIGYMHTIRYYSCAASCSMFYDEISIFVITQFVGGLGLSWQLSFGILVLLYFYSHYFFASGAAHIGAMFTAFLSVATALGTPPFFGAMVLSFLSNLMGGLTHYGIGSAPVFFGANYVPLAKWWGYGFVISIVNIIIWLGLGSIWWKFIGLW
jgi:di/tricarboxylate transporter